MADSVTTKVINSYWLDYKIQITNVSDGTGETDAIKIDKSTLTIPAINNNGLAGAEPTSIVINRIYGSTSGMAVVLEWDHTADDLIAVCQGEFDYDYRPHGGIKDPGSAGGTGDVVATTVGHTSGDTYNIILECRLKV